MTQYTQALTTESLQVNELEDAVERLKVAAETADAELAGSAASLAEMRRLEAANHALQQRVSQLQGQARTLPFNYSVVVKQPPQQSVRIIRAASQSRH